MQIRIGLEDNIEGQIMAWALDYPGCFAFGNDEPEALIQLPRALLQYELWIKDHTSHPWIDFTNIDVRVVERFTTFHMGEDYKPAPAGEGYEVNAWFTDDWRPLSSDEIEQALLIFRWQRDELLAGLATLEPAVLTREHPDERWNILGIARHIANAELWYLSRMDLTSLSRQDLPQELEERLSQTAAQIMKVFPDFVDQVKVIGKLGEFWSYRKLVRRILYHQRDHIEHIKALAFNR